VKAGAVVSLCPKTQTLGKKVKILAKDKNQTKSRKISFAMKNVFHSKTTG